jgi:hypothetical protein
MSETRIELTGWKAVAVAAIILVFSGYRAYSRIHTVTDEGREALRAWLVKDYTGRGPKDMARRVADYRAGVPDRAPDVPAIEPRVEFTSLSAHGSGDTMIVRCEITADGTGPPDDRPLRYLFLTTKPGGGWMVFSESDSYAYYTALLGLRSRYDYRSDQY